MKRCIIHRSDCRHVLLRRGKPLNEMGPDGGWFQFATEGEASKFFREHVQTYGIERMKQCDDCY